MMQPPSPNLTPRERLIYLRDYLRDEVPDEHFDMREWDCGTAACGGGWAQRLFLPGTGLEIPSGLMAETLGLTPFQANTLFFMYGDEEGNETTLGMDEVTRTMIVAVLDHYLETSVMSWYCVTA